MHYSNKSILVVVQARMQSSRLPGKVLMPILGETLLYRMIERLKMIKYSVEIVIATSTEKADDAIEAEAQKMNLYCYRGSLNNLLDRHYQAIRPFEADLIVKIPSDCPLIDPKIIDEVFDYYFENEGQYDYVSNLHPASFPDGNDVEIMTIDCLQKTWLEATKPLELEHTTPYIWENPKKFAIGNVALPTGIDFSMTHRFTVDYQEDYEFIKRVFEELYFQKKDFGFMDILELLDEKPGIFQINAKYAGVNWYRNHLDELKTVTKEQTRELVF
jgi:spore coat polysaccharide biosynthesis protein SpsF